MTAFLSSLVVTAVIGIGAWALLTQEFDYSSSRVYQSQNPDAVRLSPGMGERPTGALH
ncbi:hypothetical protein [Roseibium limicola]|uniref:Uncharacterized protein n=1 Tax=Roseibium limicola TaxID=2816037 RepID=A0A939J8M8_9HYPH|nr:hypothetical protein [Roseibium limicola]MBO0345039.1 hypothetical protein [Roseibium limicola]